MKTRVRSTSIEAFHKLEDLGARQRAVYQVIKFNGPICNLEVSHRLGLPINSITPRTNELVERGLVREARRDFVPETGRKAIYWETVLDEPIQESTF